MTARKTERKMGWQSSGLLVGVAVVLPQAISATSSHADQARDSLMTQLSKNLARNLIEGSPTVDLPI